MVVGWLLNNLLHADYWAVFLLFHAATIFKMWPPMSSQKEREKIWRFIWARLEVVHTISTFIPFILVQSYGSRLIPRGLRNVVKVCSQGQNKIFGNTYMVNVFIIYAQ